MDRTHLQLGCGAGRDGRHDEHLAFQANWMPMSFTETRRFGEVNEDGEIQGTIWDHITF